MKKNLGRDINRLVSLFEIMKSIVELSEQQVEALKIMSQREGISCAELMRRAIAEYLVRHQSQNDASAFGLWKNRGNDGLEYQNVMRKEWGE